MRSRIPSYLFADSILRGPERPLAKPARLYLLMHGYEQSGKIIYDKLEPLLPQDAAVLALNGPFPIPRARTHPEEGFRLGFAWYFYDGSRDEYFIDMDIGAGFVASLLGELGFASTPTTIVGYSQGGYLAPFVALRAPQVDRVIGIACQFLPQELNEELKGPIRFRMDAIHGAQDEIVSLEIARKLHQELKRDGIQGDFIEIPGAGHKIDADVKRALERLVSA